MQRGGRQHSVLQRLGRSSRTTALCPDASREKQDWDRIITGDIESPCDNIEDRQIQDNP